MDEKMHNSVLSCHRSTPFLARASAQISARGFDVCSKHIPAFLQNDPPSHEDKLQNMSPPLFPRERRIENGKAVYNKGAVEKRKRSRLTEGLGDVEGLLKTVEVPKVDAELAEANMVLVNGWSK